MYSPISPSPTMSDYDMQYAASHNGLWLSDNDHELFNLCDTPYDTPYRVWAIVRGDKPTTDPLIREIC
jgi:hypothetical protein